jgi:hypothetical protein
VALLVWRVPELWRAVVTEPAPESPAARRRRWRAVADASAELAEEEPL